MEVVHLEWFTLLKNIFSCFFPVLTSRLLLLLLFFCPRALIFASIPFPSPPPNPPRVAYNVLLVVSNFAIVTRIQTRFARTPETIANRPSRGKKTKKKKTLRDTGEQPAGEPRICGAPQICSTVGGSDSFTLWWSQTETGGFPYQQIKASLQPKQGHLVCMESRSAQVCFPSQQRVQQPRLQDFIW